VPFSTVRLKGFKHSNSYSWLEISRALPSSDRSQLNHSQRCVVVLARFGSANITSSQAHKLSISVHPFPKHMIAKGGRLLGRPSVSPCGDQPFTSCALCSKKSLHSHDEARKSAGLDPEKSAHQALQTLSFCAYVWFASQTRPFQSFSIGTFGWNLGFHVPNREFLDRETGSKSKSNPFPGRWC
jgi:hypothetical protein